VAGAGGEELLVKSSFNKNPEDWSRDGQFIIFASLDPKTQWDLWLLPMSTRQVDRQPVALLKTPFNEVSGRFSPNGRWLAYVSDESGTSEVYVQAFPDLGSKQRISINGGNAPRWRGDGTELFYLAADGTLMSVSVKLGVNFRASTPTPLFKTRISDVGASDQWGFGTNYAVTLDGQRFLLNTVTERHAVPNTLVLNWPVALKRR
jgi:dipeptidyl aminopeptidase/acylaminoacyl peptidase